MTQSTWLEIPASSRDAPRSRWRKLVLRLLLPLAFAALLWWLGLGLAALLVVAAVVVLTVIGVVQPTWSDRIEHWMARFGVIVGRAIAVVLLTIVNLFVFTPIAFVMWVFRYDALAPGVRRDERSFWHAHTGRSLPKHQFADERTLWSQVGSAPPRRRPILRVATVIGVVALILLADLGGGWIYDQVSNETHGTAAVADDTFDPLAQPALRDSPWAAEVLAEQTALPSVKDSFLGYRMGTKASQYTNLFDGVRKSYQSTAPGKKVSVWFFGASALFGDGQRDDHTIPSEFSRLAEADGIPLEVRNYGRPGTAMWQELELFEQVVSTGQKPDLVVFYDGFNDLAWQMNVTLTTEPTNIYDSTSGQATDAGVVRHQRDGQAADDRRRPSRGRASRTSPTPTGTRARRTTCTTRCTTSSPVPINPRCSSPRVSSSATPRAAPQAATCCRQPRTRCRSSPAPRRWPPPWPHRSAPTPRSSGNRTCSRSSCVPDEQAYLGLAGYQPERWDPAVREARSLLKDTPYVDVGDALDGAAQPVLWDFVHTNEEGARLSAVALYAHLKPKLQDRVDAGQATR